MFANSSEYFDGSQTQSVIVRQPPQDAFNLNPPNFGASSSSSFGGPSSSCLPSTPITPNYNGYQPMNFPFMFPEYFANFAQQNMPPGAMEHYYNAFKQFERLYGFPQAPDPNCSNHLGSQSLQSPILANSALGGSLNPLHNRFVGVGRSNLPYDFPGSSVNFMGGQKPRKGGRRPGDEMLSEDLDPEEMDKKLKRRQRNKEAAARCRQRRLDLMTQLQEQVSREREQNAMKEKEISTVRTALEKMIDFLKSHLPHLADTDRQKFDEILNGLYNTKDQPSNNAPAFKIEPVDVPQIINDYQPQAQQALPKMPLKRPAPSLPPTSDISILEPEVKLPKIEMNQTLAQVNGGMEASEVSRPTSLAITPLQKGGPTAVLSTPSNFSQLGYGSASQFSSLFGGGCDGNMFLNQSTGLTPSGAPNVGFVAQTPTPLQTSEADLRSL